MSRFMDGETLAMIEKEAIIERFASMQGNKTQTARVLGISVNTLDSKLKQYDAEKAEQDRKDAESVEEDARNLARARGVLPFEEVSSRAKTEVPVESFKKAPEERAMPVREQPKIQEMLSKRAAGRVAK